MTTAQERLQASPALRAALDRQLAEGLLPKIGVGDIDAPDHDALEAVAPQDDLEAIVQRVGRPPLLIQNDQVVFDSDDALADFPEGTDARIKGTEKVIPSVGRVEFTNFTMAWGGTGWVIAAEGADRIVATNRHVASLVARRTADSRGVFLRDPAQNKYGASLDFKEEFGSLAAKATAFKVVDIPYLADTTAPDVAFLRITGANLPSPLQLADAEASLDELVAIIGYPAFDDRNDVTDMAKYFRDLYDVKRFAPGKVMQALAPGVVLRHDCTTLGGNSGSPVIRLSDGRVVGLHYSGIYGKSNSAVGVTTLRDLLAGKRQITIKSDAAGIVEGRADGVHSPDDLKDRAGYDPDFLGGGHLAAPWPGVPAAIEPDLVRPSDEEGAKPFEIRYTHFGVRFSRRLRQPAMTAVNIDGRHRVPIKRADDKWFRDGRIPQELQLRKEDYADLDIDRGHMVRRADPVWDDTLPVGNPADEVTALAQQANDDTFHYTNSAVQHGDMNSSSQRWLGLEDFILNSAETHGFRACVFTGPVLRDEDEEEMEIGEGVIAPREFFKLVVMVDASKQRLHATAYLLSQGDLIRKLLEKRNRTEGVEGFVLGAYRTFQVSVADLADATGWDMSRYVEFDPLAEVADRESIGDGTPVYQPLETFDQIVL